MVLWFSFVVFFEYLLELSDCIDVLIGVGRVWMVWMGWMGWIGGCDDGVFNALIFFGFIEFLSTFRFLFNF